MGLFDRLSATGLYDLRGGSKVACELCAYEAAFALLSERIDLLEPEFLKMPRERLERFSVLCAMPAEASGDEELRAALPAMLAGGGRTLEALSAYLSALGVQVELSERMDLRMLVASSGAESPGGFCADAQALKRLLEAFVPVGVGVVVNLGPLTWRMLDDAMRDADYWDYRDFTWEWFDQFGYELAR